MNTTEERIIGVLSNQFKIDASEIGSDRTFAELSIDSLVIIELGLALEDEFGIPISDGEIHDLMTISDAADVIAAKRALALWPAARALLPRALSARLSPAWGS